MKIGDLVRWTNPRHIGIGIVVRKYSDDDELHAGRISVVWQDGEGNGLGDPDHKFLELISESR